MKGDTHVQMLKYYLINHYKRLEYLKDSPKATPESVAVIIISFMSKLTFRSTVRDFG